MNIRVKFQKYGIMKFVGHLDMMRYFQKCMRRSKIDIAYSEGYSPHQIMSFAAPLGVGITSDGEYLDIEVNSTCSSQESITALNRVMADGIQVLEYKKLPDTAKTAMSLVAAADYLVYVKPGYTSCFNLMELEHRIYDFYMGQQEIQMNKQTKKSEMLIDLKPLIYDLKAVSLEDKGTLTQLKVKNPDITQLSGNAVFMKLCTGSSTNIKPELVLEAFCRFCESNYNPLAFQIHRLEVYASSLDIPVKGGQEREAYQKIVDAAKEKAAISGLDFPVFLALGELGEDIHCN